MKNMSGDFIFYPEGNEKSRCPVCGAGATDFVAMDYGTTTLYESRKCAACGTEFTEHYEYSGSYIFKDGRFESEV